MLVEAGLECQIRISFEWNVSSTDEAPLYLPKVRCWPIRKSLMRPLPSRVIAPIIEAKRR